MEYNPGGNQWTAVGQDLYYDVNPGDRLRATAWLRCNYWGQTCSTTIAIWGLGMGGPDEVSATSYVVPDDGAWHLVTEDMFTKAGFSYSHNVLRLNVYNWEQKNLDIDYAYLF